MDGKTALVLAVTLLFRSLPLSVGRSWEKPWESRLADYRIDDSDSVIKVMQKHKIVAIDTKYMLSLVCVCLRFTIV